MFTTALGPTPGQRDLQQFFAVTQTFGTSERYRDATRAEAYFWGLQHEGKKDWTDKSVPLRLRKPPIQVPLFREAVQTLESFVWGGHRFPQAVVGATRTADEPEAAGEIGPRLDAAQAAQLTRFVKTMEQKGALRRAIREASRKAITTTSAAIILGLRGGHLEAHVEVGKHCTPTFDPTNPRRVASLEILYQVEKEVPTAAGGLKKKLFWYRRTLDAQRDVVFVEVPVVPGVPPVWTEDPEKTVDHALGFCPVVWLRTQPDSADPLDGTPVIPPQLYPLLDAVDRVVSQRDRAVHYATDPQPVRIGVEDADRQALNKSPGQVWDIPTGGDVKFAEVQGPGIQRATEHKTDLVAHFRGAVRVVVLDPSALTGDISGRVLEILHAPMVAVSGDLRVDLGDDGYCDVLALALRLIVVVVQRGEDVWIPGAVAAAVTLAGAQLAGPWLDPPITLPWPPFFPPSIAEQQQRVTMTADALDKRLIAPKTAVREVADVFHVEDPDVELELIEDDRDAARDAVRATLGQLGAAPNATASGEPEADTEKVAPTPGAAPPKRGEA